MDDITFVTSNPHKAEQISRHLGHELRHQSVDITEIQSLDLHAVVEDKARRAYELIGGPVLVEDTALTITALGQLPGPLIKWFLESLGNEGLVNVITGTDRSAIASVLFCLYDGESTQCFPGSISGSIAVEPRGEQGFGWDPIFIPQGATKTWGEMTVEEQNETAMRRIALNKLTTFLDSHTV